MYRSLATLLVVFALGEGAYAQRLSVSPPPRDGFESACVVEGLNPRGDNFLAFRSGPGTRYRKVGEVYSGDQINMDRPCPTARWCYSDQVYRNGRLIGLRGFFYSRYCRVFAG